MGSTYTVVTHRTMKKQPVVVDYRCEHCGEANSYVVELVGRSSKSGDSLTDRQMERLEAKADRRLERRILAVEKKVAKGSFSWARAWRCKKCKRCQTWQVPRLWRTFFADLFGIPILLLLLGAPFQALMRNGDRPSIFGVVYLAVFVLVAIGVPVSDLVPILRIDRKNPTKPTVTIR